jgi:predicted RNase H-like HicB family nuclease
MTELMEDLAVPYFLIFTSIEEEGIWLRRAEYPELPGCVVESANTLQALQEIDELRIRIIVDMRRRGEKPPRPRPPLATGLATVAFADLDAYLAKLYVEDAT